MRGFVVGLLIGLLIPPLAIWAYLTAGSLPVATGDAMRRRESPLRRLTR